MRKSQTPYITLFFGVFTALVIVFSQVFYFQATPTLKKESKKTAQQESKSDAQNGDQTFITLPSSSMPSSAVAVELNQEGTCLFEIIFEEKSETEQVHSFSLSPGKLFSTLFRVIISPNAP